jgi:predicted nucleotidyltransferase
MTLDNDFEVFLEKLQLETRQIERMNSAERSLSTGLRQHFGLRPEDIFLQGSYANGTATKPPPSAADGEYDIDLVVISAKIGQEPQDALGHMREGLIAIGYGDRIEEDPERKRPCIRLRYAPDDAGHFHVDVVPSREAPGRPPLEIPRPADGTWKETAPQEYAEWCTDQGEEFLRTVQQLKRWRDEHQNARQAIKSIVLQVLIAKHISHGQSDAHRIAATLRSISSLMLANLDNPPQVLNPVLETENLTATWPADAYRNFIKVIGEAADLAERALTESDEVASRVLWRELLGSDFPEKGNGRSSGFVPPPPAPAARKTRQGAPRSEWA